MQQLATIRCVACEGGVPPLNPAEVSTYLSQLDSWQLSADGKSISKRFTFKGFYAAMAFANAIGWMAGRENHHPDLQVGYGYCTVVYTTHAIGGLSKNDFICAAKVDALQA